MEVVSNLINFCQVCSENMQYSDLQRFPADPSGVCFCANLCYQKGWAWKNFPSLQTRKYVQSSGLWEILDINSCGSGEKQEKQVHFLSPRKKNSIFANNRKWKLFQPLQCSMKVLRNHILFQWFVGLLMNESYCVKRCGTAERGSTSVTKKQGIFVLTAERPTQKITQTSESLDLPKSDNFRKVLIHQLD